MSAKVDDNTRGFAAPKDKNVAVCLLPGTELPFMDEVREVHSWPCGSDDGQDPGRVPLRAHHRAHGHQIDRRQGGGAGWLGVILRSFSTISSRTMAVAIKSDVRFYECTA